MDWRGLVAPQCPTDVKKAKREWERTLENHISDQYPDHMWKS
jgi:hypothetical protein